MKKSLILTIIIFSLAACTKPGTGGKAQITGHVKHHDDAIPNAIVYLKYDTKEFPGFDVALYDEETVASESDGHYSFNELKKGNYYLYATGYDEHAQESVFGGVPLTISKKNEVLEVDVPITE